MSKTADNIVPGSPIVYVGSVARPFYGMFTKYLEAGKLMVDDDRTGKKVTLRRYIQDIVDASIERNSGTA